MRPGRLSRRGIFKAGLSTIVAPAVLNRPASAAKMYRTVSGKRGKDALRHENHRFDFCVVGGGLAGMCAAIAAARHGAKVALGHDRPVLGGNASSEIRMHVCGAHGENNRETGIIDEIQMENCYRNPNSIYSIWDSVLYEKVRFEPNIELFLNCSCNDIEMDGNRIHAIKAWQTTAEIWHRIEAKYFADCSGDSILAPLSGADFRIGRESSSEFNEDIEPAESDRKTMGMSCLLQARETDSPKKYIPPSWANVYKSEEDFPHRGHNIHITSNNFWWIELGGEGDSIHDTERLRDELLKVTFGVWDHVKNYGDHGAENWELEWLGFLPGKRESRRYVGDHILTQNDVRAEGRFDDLIAYGGWSMDDHHPGGFRYPGKPTIFHPAPSPFGIPYRSLYSKNIENLFCAGRNISATHAAMSATRVMATCATIGQAAGTAASIAVRDSLTPREVFSRSISELKQTLMEDDCYLPFNSRAIPDLTRSARITSSNGDPSALVNGIDRPVGAEDNGILLPTSGNIHIRFDNPRQVRTMRLVFNSGLSKRLLMPSSLPKGIDSRVVPGTIGRSYHVDARDSNGSWKTVHREDNNYSRMVRIPLETRTSAVRFVLDSTWGADAAHIFACDAS